MIAELVLAAALHTNSGYKADTYTVQPGDTLSSITPNWHELYRLNQWTIGSNPNAIRPGMVLQMPHNPDRSAGFSSSENTAVVSAGQSLSEIASILGYDWKTIAHINGITAPYVVHPGQVLRLA